MWLAVTRNMREQLMLFANDLIFPKVQTFKHSLKLQYNIYINRFEDRINKLCKKIRKREKNIKTCISFCFVFIAATQNLGTI